MKMKNATCFRNTNSNNIRFVITQFCNWRCGVVGNKAIKWLRNSKNCQFSSKLNIRLGKQSLKISLTPRCRPHTFWLYFLDFFDGLLRDARPDSDNKLQNFLKNSFKNLTPQYASAFWMNKIEGWIWNLNQGQST